MREKKQIKDILKLIIFIKYLMKEKKYCKRVHMFP
jgi:hypothetical protein